MSYRTDRALHPSLTLPRMPDLPTLTAHQLRALAEAADSYRGKSVCLVRTADAASPYAIVPIERTSPAERILELRTEDVSPVFVARTQGFTLTSSPIVRMVNHPDMGIGDADAVFTSLAAVEKFVRPYYARYKTPADVDEMRNRFATTPSALAVCHLPDSIEDTLSAGGLFALIAGAADGTPVVPMPIDTWLAGFN